MIKLLSRSFLVMLLSLSAAFAANVPYDKTEFNKLMQEGKPVVLHFHASWCPTCRAQQKVLDDLMPMPEFRNLPVLRVNYDTEKALLRKYKVHNQSTFIIFNHGKEITRSTGETDSPVIADLLKKAF